MARIVDQLVLQTVDRVARGHYLVGHHGELGRGDWRPTQRTLVPHGTNREAGLAHPGRVRHDTVEVLGIALGLDEALAPAVRAGVPVGVRYGLAVIVGRDRLGGRGRQVHGAIGVVDGLL